MMSSFHERYADRGVRQCVILGAGLATFAQRRPEIASRLRVFEVDPPGPQGWKRRRLTPLGFGIPDWLRFVPLACNRQSFSQSIFRASLVPWLDFGLNYL